MGEKNDVSEGTSEESANIAGRMNNQVKYFLDLIIFTLVPLSHCPKKRLITELIPFPRKIFAICGDFCLHSWHLINQNNVPLFVFMKLPYFWLFFMYTQATWILLWVFYSSQPRDLHVETHIDLLFLFYAILYYSYFDFKMGIGRFYSLWISFQGSK